MEYKPELVIRFVARTLARNLEGHIGSEVQDPGVSDEALNVWWNSTVAADETPVDVRADENLLDDPEVPADETGA